jgi:hypothetical protein
MEEVIVTAIVFGSLLAAIKLWLDYRRDKNQISATSRHSEPSLTTSELKALLTEAVEEVVDARIDRLEERLEAHDRPRLAPFSTATQPHDAELEHPAQPLVGRDREATQ